MAFLENVMNRDRQRSTLRTFVGRGPRLVLTEASKIDATATFVIMSWTAAYCESVAREFVEPLGDRLRHVQGVAQTATTWSQGVPESSFIVGSAWLHDIGYAPELYRTGMHAIDGALFLDLAGAPKEIVSLVAFHTGAEFEAEERGLIDKIIQFDRPRQDWIDALILADLLTGSGGERVTVCQRLDEIFQRYEPQHPVHRAVVRSRAYLENCAGRAAARVGLPDVRV